MSRVTVASPEGWARACSTAFVPLRIRSTARSFSASLSQLALGPAVTVTGVESEASTVYRDDRLIAEHPRDDILLSLHRRGRGAVQQHGRAAALGAGSAVLYDASTPYALSFPATMSEVVLQLPRGVVARSGNAFESLTAITLPDSVQLRALTMLAAAVDDRPGATDAEASALGEAIVSLLRAVIAGDRDDREPEADARLLLAGIRMWIGEHADHPDLVPSDVAQHFHVSLRTLQKVFASDADSPAACIRRARLERAHRLLLAGASVSSAAHRSGFHDADGFARTFKREIGVTPSQARLDGAGNG